MSSKVLIKKYFSKTLDYTQKRKEKGKRNLDFLENIFFQFPGRINNKKVIKYQGKIRIL